jgi:hypothetical protein
LAAKADKSGIDLKFDGEKWLWKDQ